VNCVPIFLVRKDTARTSEFIVCFLCVMVANSMWNCSDCDIRLDKTGRLKQWDCVIMSALLSAKEPIIQIAITQATVLS